MITVEDALRRGQLTVKMPGTLIMLGAWGQALLLGPSGMLTGPALYVSLGLGVLSWPISLLYTAIATPRWKLWAYPQAHNLAMLRERAVATKLLPPPGSFFDRLEICSAEERAQIRKLEGRAP